MSRLSAPGRAFDAEPLRIADVGTGSGAVAIAVAAELRRRQVPIATVVRILATDLWPEALDLARENAVAHGVADTLSFAEADLLPLDLPDRRRFDIVAANLPYVRSDAIAGLPIAASFEPRSALDGGPGRPRRDPGAARSAARRSSPMTASRCSRSVATRAPRRRRRRRRPLPGWTSSIEPDLGGLPRVMRVSR